MRSGEMAAETLLDERVPMAQKHVAYREAVRARSWTNSKPGAGGAEVLPCGRSCFRA